MGFAATSWKIEGPTEGKRFSLVFVGADATPARLANKANSMLRPPSGEWTRLETQGIRLFVNRDASPKMAKIQAALRRLAHAIRQVGVGLHDKISVVKPTFGQHPMRGFIRVSGMLIAQITAEHQEEEAELFLSLPALSSQSLSKDAILEAYEKRAAAPNVENIAWCK